MSFYIYQDSGCTTPRVGPNVNYGVRVMVCQCRLMVLTGTHSGAVYGIDGGAEQEPRGPGSNGNALYFLLHFPMNLPRNVSLL